MKMSLKAAIRAISAASILDMFVMLAMFVLMNIQLKKAAQLTKDLEATSILVDELWDVSQTLTNQARLYVSTGNEKYFTAYHYLLDWRNGKAIRPSDGEIVMIHSGETISEMELFKALGASDKEINLYQKSIDLSEKLAKLETQAMQTIKQERFVEGYGVMNEGERIKDFATRILCDDAYQDEVMKIKKPLNDLYKAFDLRRDETNRAEQRKLFVLDVGTGIAMFLFIMTIIVLVMFLNRNLLHPILKTSKCFLKLGEGDLTQEIDVAGQNEIGDMANAFNAGLHNIRNLIMVIKKNSRFLTGLGQELSENINETMASITQINENIESTKNDVQTQSVSVSETASTIEQMIRTIKSLTESIEMQSTGIIESSSSIEEMIANINSISTMLDSNNEMMKRLNEKAANGKAGTHRANEVVTEMASQADSLIEASNIIQSIASQTNLLAMNAAIEAAHAGDSGKGFAVVADEIRKLAEESSTQGKKISKALKESNATIKELVVASSEAENIFNETHDLIATVAKKEDSITLSMQEQANGNKEVLLAMKQINESTEQVKQGSNEMLAGSETVAKEMQRLSEISINITNRMNEVASGTEQISEAVKEVTGMTDKNRNVIDHLHREAEKFKV